MNDQQKLVDLCFEIALYLSSEALYLSSEDHPLRYGANDEKAAWIANQLRSCGFDTTPCGSSWGILKEEIDE